MTPKNKYQAYAAATQTVAPTRQIVMLYDGVIRFMQQAREAVREKRIEDRYNLLIKASEVISGLQGCLDFAQGGDIARLLYNFYSSVDNRIFSIHHSNSLETCDTIISELKQMRDSWHEIDRGLTQDAAPAIPSPPANNAPKDPAKTSPESDQNITLSA